MNKIEKHSDLIALTQLPAASLTVEDIRELQAQLRIRLDREMAVAKDEAIRDLLDMSTEQLRTVSPAARAVVFAHDAEGEDTTEEAEAQYFLKHPQVLALYLPKHLE